MVNQGKQIATSKKVRKGAIICLLVVVAVIVISVGSKYLIEQNELRTIYNDATEYFETGDYTNAEMLFKTLGEYKDAESMVLQSKYNLANQLLEEKSYQDAIDLFQEISGFDDSEQMVLQAKKAYADYLCTIEKYDKAIKLYESLGENTKALVETKIARADQLYRWKLFSKAKEMYLSVLADCPDDYGLSEEIQRCKYVLATIYSDFEEYEEAEELLLELGDYKDSAELLSEVQANKEMKEQEEADRSNGFDYHSSGTAPGL